MATKKIPVTPRVTCTQTQRRELLKRADDRRSEVKEQAPNRYRRVPADAKRKRALAAAVKRERQAKDDQIAIHKTIEADVEQEYKEYLARERVKDIELRRVREVICFGTPDEALAAIKSYERK